MFCSKNISAYGYIAVAGATKLSIYLAYADECTSSYDHVWTISKYDLQFNKCGRQIELGDFTDTCEEFLSYSKTGEIAMWSIKDKKFILHQMKLSSLDLPLSHVRAVPFDG